MTNPFISSVRGLQVCQPIIIFFSRLSRANKLISDGLPVGRLATMASASPRSPPCVPFWNESFLFLNLAYLLVDLLHLCILIWEPLPPCSFLFLLSPMLGGPVSWLHADGHAGTHNHQWKTHQKNTNWKNLTPPLHPLFHQPSPHVPCPIHCFYESSLNTNVPLSDICPDHIRSFLLFKFLWF